MSNVLKVSHQEAVRSLHAKKWSQRRIARELGIHRKTVWRYTQKLAAKCTISTPGSETASAAKCTISTSGVAGRRSDCDPFAGVILSKLGLGLCAQRIFQDLGAETGFEGSYQSVKRFVRRVQATHPERVWRMECEPGEEMQVDFGLGAMIEQENGRARRSWVFRVVLSYSRKGYSEAVFRQDTETFLRCLENAVRHFGGVPLVLNIDNLKAAVLQADWFDPEINPKLAEFCRHYGRHGDRIGDDQTVWTAEGWPRAYQMGNYRRQPRGNYDGRPRHCRWKRPDWRRSDSRAAAKPSGDTIKSMGRAPASRNGAR
jgi:transposase